MKMKKNQQEKIKTIEKDGKTYILETETGQLLEILSDKSSSGRERPWRTHKIANQDAEKCYRLLADKHQSDYYLRKADRLNSCGCHLDFNVYSDGTKKIKNAESCRVRLCPLCSWRRSIKIQAHTRKILEHMQADETQYRYIMLTLTVPNCKSSELSATLDNMLKAWDRLQKYKKYKSAVVGWYRGLEITHNVSKYRYTYKQINGKSRRVYLCDDYGNRILNSSYDTYHPHFHVILAVPPSYFGKNYIKQPEWLAMWRKATRDDSITQVDVRNIGVKPAGQALSDTSATSAAPEFDIISAVCEVAKYTVKSADYIMPTSWEMSCRAVETLDSAIDSRRLVAYGGILKDWHKRLNLDDEIDGDLIGDVQTPDGVECIGELSAFWHVGYQQYLIDN